MFIQTQLYHKLACENFIEIGANVKKNKANKFSPEDWYFYTK